MFSFLPPESYSTLHLLVVSLLTVFCSFSVYHQNAYSLITKRRNTLSVILYALLFVVIVGLRPVSEVFGDTVNYARTYLEMQGNPLDLGNDVLFSLLMWWCAQRMSVEYFFLIVEVLYIVPMLFACKRMMDNNYDIAILFCFAAFSFFSYSVNGIRNGMACSIVMLALTYYNGKLLEKIICALLALIAINVHESTALPVICMIAASLIKSPKPMFVFWGFSIIISLIAGVPISNLFANMGFDERLSDYILSEADEGIFSHSGFRWDFLLYSAVPIIFGYYLIFKKRVFDRSYLLLLGTYIYSNSFWVMVIRAEYSNRFAYLSWFLYPLVLAYPLLKLEIWPKTQGRKTAFIMAAHLAFTIFMVFIYG